MLQQDYAQMKLMDLENEQLCQKAFGKDKQKAAKNKLTSGQACHMTASEMMDLLAQQTWESAMGELFKEASEWFKAVIYTPPPIPVGLRLFQKVRSDSGRTNWNPVDSGGFQFVQLEMLDLEHYNG